MNKLVPIVFAHMCCNGDTVFGQAANGDGYFRMLSWGDRPWAPVPPPMGVSSKAEKRSDSKPARRGTRR